MISVIIPVKDAEKTIKASIDSVLAQGINDIEIICVINNCTDDTEKIINQAFSQEKRIKTIRSNSGIVPALNEGIRFSKGEIIARQDADDVWLPNKLENQLKFLEKNKEIDILGTQLNVVDQFNNLINVTNYPTEHKVITNSLLFGNNSIGHPSVVFKRKILDKCAGYLDLFPMAEDMDLWIRAANWYKLANLSESFVEYRHVHNPKYNPKVPQLLSTWYRMIYGVS